jgi:putative tryptophan/tyrosine transport system substrate-binding protein
MNKKPVWLVTLFLLAAVALADAQQPKKVPMVGYLSGSGDANNPGSNLEGFRQGLREFGYVDGKNVQVEYRYAKGNVDIVPRLVAELVQLKAMCLSSRSCQRSVQPSRRPRRFLLSW